MLRYLTVSLLGTVETELAEKSYRVLVDKSETVSAEAGECEWRSRRVWIVKLRAEYDNKIYDGIVISSLYRVLLVKLKHH